MQLEYDLVKDVINRSKHGISLADAVQFDWDTAQIEEDARFDYPERRFEATGYIGHRLYVVVFCFRGPAKRIISLRKANKREYRDYAKA